MYKRQDLCLIFTDPNSVSSISGWTSTSTAGMYYFKKIVVSGDLGTPITVQDSGGPHVAAVSVSLRDCSIATQKASGQDNPVTDITLAGFTRNASHKGIVGCAWSYELGPSPTTSGAWSSSAQRGDGDIGRYLKTSTLVDNSYISGSSITFGTIGPGGIGAVILELT